MNENLYEGMFLFDSSAFANDPEGLSQMLVDMIEKIGGTVDAHRPWQDGRLAYEIKGRRKGLHYIVMFRCDPARMDELDRACRLNDRILRQMVIKHPPVLFDAMVGSINPEAAEETAEETAEATG